MLVVSRTPGESILIGEFVRLRITSIYRSFVDVTVEGPNDFRIESLTHGLSYPLPATLSLENNAKLRIIRERAAEAPGEDDWSTADEVNVIIADNRFDRVRIGIDAPKHISIVRDDAASR